MFVQGCSTWSTRRNVRKSVQRAPLATAPTQWAKVMSVYYQRYTVKHTCLPVLRVAYATCGSF